MGEERERPTRRDFFRRRWEEPSVDFPSVPLPEGSKITPKLVGYLHVYCRKSPAEIAARYPRAVTLAQVHLGLYHYFTNREAIDAVIEAELAFNARDSLGAASMTLPRATPSSPVETRKGDT
jgi:hypothetical protein